MQRCAYQFGDCVFEPEQGTLFRLGVPLPISYRGIQLLEALVKQCGSVVSKADLLNAAWPGAIVEESNLTNQIAALRKHLEGSTEGECIVTVPRVGYRFVAHVTVKDRDPVAQHKPPEPERVSRPSLAVLPFPNLSVDVDQQYFADGLTEEIIARLSQLRWLFLAARNSSFSFRAPDVDARKVGAELGVRYVLVGSVKRSEDRIRVITQLCDTTTGGQIWTERLERKLSDFFSLQDEITMSVVAALEPELYAAERQRLNRQSPDNLDAWGLVMRALPLVWTWTGAEELETAHRYLKSAVALEPGYARAHCLLAWTEAAMVHAGHGDPKEVLLQAEERAVQAVRIDPVDPWTHFAIGYVRMLKRDFRGALEGQQRALELNPSFAFAHMMLGAAYAYNGMSEEGLRHLGLASNVSPRDFNAVAVVSTTGLCCFIEENYSEAIQLEQRAVQLRPQFATAWRTLAAAAGLAGEQEVGQAAIARSLSLQPNLSLAWVEQFHPIVKPELRDRYIEGLHRSGLS